MTFVLVIKELNTFTMIELKKHYENSKNRAVLLMETGNINDYLNELIEMNRYKKLMLAVARN